MASVKPEATAAAEVPAVSSAAPPVDFGGWQGLSSTGQPTAVYATPESLIAPAPTEPTPPAPRRQLCTDGDVKVDDKDESPFYEHEVKSTDTLSRICLQYNVSVKLIKRYNDFPGDNFYALSTIRIPKKNIPASVLAAAPNAKATQAQTLRDFARRNGVSTKEAQFYLLEHNYDVDKAQAELDEDMGRPVPPAPTAPDPPAPEEPVPVNDKILR